ncbi:MAG TPA: copper homeostasis protein CutC [Terriglobales bacterium]|jgi:copper homeostasis protein|nr:copper homeostasis protein CutC [Terriglobales bacterium]
MAITVEICIDCTESAVAAERGGAQRVELCSDLVEGGITPSAGLIATVRQKVKIGVQVMIRPRGGDFHYSAEEFDIMRRDIRMAKQLGANGVVFGLLDIDGNVEVERTRELVELARPLNVTYHRAFDMARDLDKSLEDVIATGADRILTSGAEVAAAVPTLKRLIVAAGERIIILVGGGLKPHNAPKVIAETGAKEIHAGLRTTKEGPMRYRNEKLVMGTIPGLEYDRTVVLEKDVSALVRAVNR